MDKLLVNIKEDKNNKIPIKKQRKIFEFLMKSYNNTYLT